MSSFLEISIKNPAGAGRAHLLLELEESPNKRKRKESDQRITLIRDQKLVSMDLCKSSLYSCNWRYLLKNGLFSEAYSSITSTPYNKFKQFIESKEGDSLLMENPIQFLCFIDFIQKEYDGAGPADQTLLETNLINHLTEKGIFSDPDCIDFILENDLSELLDITLNETSISKENLLNEACKKRALQCIERLFEYGASILTDTLPRIYSLEDCEIKWLAIANFVNENRVPIKDLHLNKSELLRIAPFLTFLDTTEALIGWKTTEIYHLLETAAPCLEMLIIHNGSLKRIPPECCRLQYLDCSLCLNLEFLKFETNSLREIYCQHCPSLESLQEGLSNLRLLNCLGCSKLRTLPKGLRSLKSLICSLCKSLEGVPEDLKRLRNIEYFECPNFDTSTLPKALLNLMIVKIADLNEDPVKILKMLGRCIAKKGEIPPISYVEDRETFSESLDEGGLKRSFIFRLLKSLIKKELESRNALFMQTSGGVIPTFPNEVNPDSVEYFFSLGCLFTQLLKDPLLTMGNNFLDPTFFSFLQTIFTRDIDPIISAQRLPTISDAKRIELLAQIEPERGNLFIRTNKDIASILIKDYASLTDEEFSVLSTYVKTMTLEQQDPSNKTQIYRKAKNLLLNYSKETDYILPSLLIAHTMKHLLEPSQREELLTCEKQLLQKRMEGTFNKDFFLKKRKIHNLIGEEGSARQEQELLTKDYIEQWLEEANDQQLKKFIYTLTGSPTLALDVEHLIFHFFEAEDDNQLPFVHTCSFQIDIPINCAKQGPEGYSLFKQKLEFLIAQSINETTSGFQGF